MSVVIFTGPSLSAADARRELQAEYRPPAEQGDVYRAAQNSPQVIGIIDGYFERVPSVWHKEILWAMSRGIHVFGSASMGALRAAELDAFGMEGVGSIFEAFRDGTLEDDDEVAVVHASREFDFRTASEAMVDIRHTLTRAVESDVLRASTAAAIESGAKSMFYPDRTYPRIIARAIELSLPRAELDALQEWLPRGRTSLKRADAVAMLPVIRERVAAGVEPKRVQYSFENSSMWEQAWRFAGEAYSVDGEVEATLLNEILEELRVESGAYVDAQQSAMLRTLAIKQSYVQGIVDASRQLSPPPSLWRRPDVYEDVGKQQWMRDNNLDDARLAALLADEARVRWIKELATLDATGCLLDQLRVSGDYPRLLQRARAKQRSLSSLGLDNPTPADARLNASELFDWYFKERLGREVPSDLDDYVRAIGFANRQGFERALLREYCFVEGRRAAADHS
jgi:hypothetical protein